MPADKTSVFIDAEMASEARYKVFVAAVNVRGKGPYGEWDGIKNVNDPGLEGMFPSTSVISGNNGQVSPHHVTLVASLTASVVVFLVLALAAMILAKRHWKSRQKQMMPHHHAHHSVGGGNDSRASEAIGCIEDMEGQPSGLHASIIKNRGLFSTSSSADKRNRSLWIDRRSCGSLAEAGTGRCSRGTADGLRGSWNYDEKGSDSSEQKLLLSQASSSCQPSEARLQATEAVASKVASTNNSTSSSADTEYAYVVDRHNRSSFSCSSSSRRTPAGPGVTGGGADSPEPYATTDIFSNQRLNEQQLLLLRQHPQLHHYGQPRLVLSSSGPKGVRSCDNLYGYSDDEVDSYLDDGTASPGMPNCFIVGQMSGARSGSPRSQARKQRPTREDYPAAGSPQKTKKYKARHEVRGRQSPGRQKIPGGPLRTAEDRPPRSILDFLPPPPPGHPPPPPSSASSATMFSTGHR